MKYLFVAIVILVIFLISNRSGYFYISKGAAYKDCMARVEVDYITKKGVIITYYDPSGEKNVFKKIQNCFYKKDIKSNCFSSDLIILLTEWDEFKSINFKNIVKNRKFKVYDLRNLYNADEMKKNKIKYYSVGRPDINLFQK